MRNTKKTKVSNTATALMKELYDLSAELGGIHTAVNKISYRLTELVDEIEPLLRERVVDWEEVWGNPTVPKALKKFARTHKD